MNMNNGVADFWRSKLPSAGFALTVALATAFSTARVEATSIQFDDKKLHGGTLSYDGLGGPLVGTDIVLDHILGSGTPANDGAELEIRDGLLNFKTGGFDQKVGDIWLFEEGGSFTVTGDVYDAPAPGGNLVAQGVLLTGDFSSSPAPLFAGVVGGSLGTFSGHGPDSKNEDLVGFYGLTALNWDFSNTEITTGEIEDLGDGAFQAAVGQADVLNSLPDSGMTLVLLGASVMGLSIFSRRRKA